MGLRETRTADQQRRSWRPLHHRAGVVAPHHRSDARAFPPRPLLPAAAPPRKATATSIGGSCRAAPSSHDAATTGAHPATTAPGGDALARCRRAHHDPRRLSSTTRKDYPPGWRSLYHLARGRAREYVSAATTYVQSANRSYYAGDSELADLLRSSAAVPWIEDIKRIMSLQYDHPPLSALVDERRALRSTQNDGWPPATPEQRSKT